MADLDFSESVLIAYPVEYPSGRFAPPIKDIHSTVLWLGEKKDLPDVGELWEMLETLDTNHYVWADVKGVEWFGTEKNIPVLRLRDTVQLWQTYHEVSMLLARNGIFSASEFGYAPHVSLSYGNMRPAAVYQYIVANVLLHPMQLWYGEDKHPIGKE